MFIIKTKLGQTRTLLDGANSALNSLDRNKFYGYYNAEWYIASGWRANNLELAEVITYKDAIRHRNEVLLPSISTISREANNELGKVPVSSYNDAKGGVKKKFFPQQGVVVAGHKGTAAGDYRNEDAVSARLETFSDKKYNYVSFQRELEDFPDNEERLRKFLEENRENQKVRGLEINQIRRVSVYGDYDKFSDGTSDQYHTTLEKFLFDTKPSQKPTEAELFSCIHQIVKIHDFLYQSNVVHGDMHMGNIKVIRTRKGVLLKAFDFGKATVKPEDSSPTRKDLRYLIDQKAVSGPHETFNRWRRSSINPKMVKHYPLHKVILELANLGWKEHANPGNANPVWIETMISKHGKHLLNNLEALRAVRNLPAMDRHIITQGMFSVFSDLIVCNTHSTFFKKIDS